MTIPSSRFPITKKVRPLRRSFFCTCVNRASAIVCSCMKTHTHNEMTKLILTNPVKVRDLVRLTLATCWEKKTCGAVNVEYDGEQFTMCVSIIGDGKGGERMWINDAYMVPSGKMTWLLRDMKMTACVKAVSKKEKKKEKREHESLTDEELQEYHANALATRQGAGGHGKAHYNDLRVKAYLAEMKARGQKPDGRVGSFNGIGCY